MRPQTRGQIYGGAARQLYRDVAAIKRLINVEEKYFDLKHTSLSLSSAWAAYEVNAGIARGTGPNERDGISLKSTSISVTGVVSYNPLYAAKAQTARLVLVRKDVVNASAVVSGQLFDAGIGGNNVLALHDPEKSYGFYVAADQIITVTAENPDYYFDIYRTPSQHTKWSSGDTTGSIATMYEGLWQILLVTDAASNFPTIVFQSRFKYVDN
jgi:hypothetical protein